ncbi:hypothetical protein H4W32_004281 [Actinophytocola algeriensis]|jgi:hypothetical protein|uniref:Uncharacterized protein n=1 Tax=Actinophytocola algeriensis TaxID=1768010 RepID=A0A7W7Q131_9PSEU|nr:hypothetical protein [Actinophytocola algeriensis]MBE1476239.1 hypothetical protein [Actinophytocola algeriensis]
MSSRGCTGRPANSYGVHVTDFKLPLYGSDTERGDLAP